MKTQDFLPTEQLGPFVKAYKIIESEQGLINRIVPNTCFTLAFRLTGKISYLHTGTNIVLPATIFSGLRRTARLVEYGRDSATLIVLFRQQGASSFFRQPLHELFGQSVPLDFLVPIPDVSRIEQRLAEETENRSKIALVEQFLLARLFDIRTDKLVAEAISQIHFAKGIVKIRDLANQLHISQDAFEKRFRKTAGATPKQFAHIVKMNAVICQSKAKPSFPDIAFESGYCDQPHFNKDFKIFTGQTPTEFFRSPLYW